MHNNPIIAIIFKLVIPYIVIYALYIQIAGENSPGGGFQAGAIFASGLIGLDMLKYLTISSHIMKNLLRIAAIGVMIYIMTGVYSIICGGNFLDYDLLWHIKPYGQQIGIFIVEIGIGLAVASILSLIYVSFKVNE